MPPFFSICMPIYKGVHHLIRAAIQSVAAQTFTDYELIMIMDGNNTEIDDSLLSELSEMQHTIIRQTTHRGVSFSRNNGISQSTGNVIVFLDCDNVYNPLYLETLYHAYTTHETVNCAYCALQYKSDLRIEFMSPFDRIALLQRNYIDINVFSFRRTLFELYGGFDETLSRLVDWDIILNYTQHETPLAIDYVAVYYNNDCDRYRISLYENIKYNYYAVQHKYIPFPPLLQSLRILYFLHQYCQLSETYVDWEMNYLLSLGASVRVVAMSDKPASPVQHDKIVYTNIHTAVQDFKPHLIHVHWIHMYSHVRAYQQQYSLSIPITIRIHGFEHSNAILRIANADPNVKMILSYPHVTQVSKSVNMRIPIYPPIHYPPAACKDRTKIIVTRVGACLPTKELCLFVDIANEVRQLSNAFEFHLAVIVCHTMEHVHTQLLEYNASKNNPCIITTNLSRTESADLLRRSSVFLHTIGNDKPYGQPISIAEALACGNYVIAKELPGGTATRDYIGKCGTVYTTKTEAIQALMQTAQWCDNQWKNVLNDAVAYAYTQFVPEAIYSPFMRCLMSQLPSS